MGNRPLLPLDGAVSNYAFIFLMCHGFTCKDFELATAIFMVVAFHSMVKSIHDIETKHHEMPASDWMLCRSYNLI